MLSRVHFTGIKSLRDVSVDLTPFTVLVGPNGCGKSTLLNQIELLCRSSAPTSDVLPPHALGTPGMVLSSLDPARGPLVLRSAGVPSSMTWQGVSDDDRELTIKVPGAQDAWWQYTTVTARVGPNVVSPGGSPDGPRAGAELEEALRADFSWRAQRLRLMPDDIARPSPVDRATLEPSGFGLATVLKDLAANDTDTYTAVQDDLRSVVPQFQRLRFGKGKDGAVDTNELFLEMVGGGRLPAAQVSDGTLLALAVLTAARNPDLPPILLLDDLDHGLHLGAQYAMVEALRQAGRSRPELQVLCTTHSPVLLDCLEIAEVRVMALNAEGHTKVRPLAEHPKLDGWREGFSAGELWANLGEEWVAGA